MAAVAGKSWAEPEVGSYLSEEGTIEGDSVEAVNRAHVDV